MEGWARFAIRDHLKRLKVKVAYVCEVTVQLVVVCELLNREKDVLWFCVINLDHHEVDEEDEKNNVVLMEGSSTQTNCLEISISELTVSVTQRSIRDGPRFQSCAVQSNTG